MSDHRTLPLSATLIDYAIAHGTEADDAVARDLRVQTLALGPVAGMQIGADQGQLLTLLARMANARRVVEVGTFTGYSALCIARGLAAGGTITCCDLSEEWTTIARRAWERAGVAARIDLRLAPALDTLRALPADPHLDLVFIDADKGGYVDYWGELVPRVRPGGLIVADNVLWSGRVADINDDEADTLALRAFNRAVANDQRVDALILPAFDGLTIARRR
jgi:caffeoyl-CoA O-methyltransferase